jgi:hypothetical protein
MALLICGIEDREDLLSPEMVDRRRSLGRFLKGIEKYSEFFFSEGSDLEQLKSALKKSYGGKLEMDSTDASGKGVRRFVEEHVRSDHPVLLGLDSKDDYGHWVLVIGLEYQTIDPEPQKLCRFLVLDPGDPSSKVCAWNGVIDARASGGRYPFEWWTSDEGLKVQFDTALALWPK